MRRLLVVTAILAIAAAVAFCQPGAAGKIDPCGLVTKADIQTATGAAVEDGKLNAINKEVCEYKVGNMGGIVNFVARQTGPAETPDRIASELNKRKMETTDVAGVGDRAFFAKQSYGMVQLNAFKGNKYVIVTALVPGAPEAKTKAACEQLARKALAKL
jgi:hypothetical protein